MLQRTQPLSVSNGPGQEKFRTAQGKRGKTARHTAIGVGLERKKEASLVNWNLKRPYPPEKVRIPVPCFSEPCVPHGKTVQTGQKIAEARGPGGVNVYASLSGVIEKIGVFPDAKGGESLMMEIRKHGEPKPAPPYEIKKDWEQTPTEEILKICRDAGVVTTDPSEEPVHAKIGRHGGAGTVVINGCEPEPYVTCEQILIMSHSLEVLKGAELLRKAAGAGKILFALEDYNLETIELIKSKIYFLKWDHVEVRAVPALYPQGLEGTLLQAWFGGEEETAAVFPASTAFAVYEAVALQKPFYERIVTVGGECVVEPRSLWLPIGFSIRDAIRACKGVMREPQKVLMGGPMAGTAQSSEEAPVTAGTNAVLALPKEIAKDESEEPCIRCNLCVDHCPVGLSPAMITLASEHGEFATAESWHVRDCIECGNCAYVCPSKRPMLERIRAARVSTGTGGPCG